MAPFGQVSLRFVGSYCGRCEETCWPVHKAVPDLIRIAVAIDPAVSSGEEADETGIIVAGKDADGHGYVLADQSGRYAPTEWARTAIGLYRQYKTAPRRGRANARRAPGRGRR